MSGKREQIPNARAAALWRQTVGAPARPAPEATTEDDLLDLAAWLDGRLEGPAHQAFEARLARNDTLLSLALAARADQSVDAGPAPEALRGRALALVRAPVRDTLDLTHRISAWLGLEMGPPALRRFGGAMAMLALMVASGYGAFGLGQQTYENAATADRLLVAAVPIDGVLAGGEL